MIIDFRVQSRHNKPVDFKAFTDTSATSSYGGIMGRAMDTPLETKTELVRKSLEDWNLPPKIDEAFCHILQFVKDAEFRCDSEFHNNILEQYVADVKWTLEKLQNHLCPLSKFSPNPIKIIVRSTGNKCMWRIFFLLGLTYIWLTTNFVQLNNCRLTN